MSVFGNQNPALIAGRICSDVEVYKDILMNTDTGFGERGVLKGLYVPEEKLTVPLFTTHSVDMNGRVKEQGRHRLSAVGHANGVYVHRVDGSLVSLVPEGDGVYGVVACDYIDEDNSVANHKILYEGCSLDTAIHHVVSNFGYVWFDYEGKVIFSFLLKIFMTQLGIVQGLSVEGS